MSPEEKREACRRGAYASHAVRAANLAAHPIVSDDDALAHVTNCSCSLACELRQMRRRTLVRRALKRVQEAADVDVCGACSAPISMKPDARSRRKHTRPENYRCPKCADVAIDRIDG